MRAASTELQYSIINAWDQERGVILSHNAEIITVDTLTIAP
jgi:hypothetical protein